MVDVWLRVKLEEMLNFSWLQVEIKMSRVDLRERDPFELQPNKYLLLCTKAALLGQNFEITDFPATVKAAFSSFTF